MSFVTICVLFGCCWPAAVPATSDRERGGPIDRQALVTRHNVVLSKPDPLTPLSIGNGEFAFTADITGLQTFPEYHRQGMPLGTYSQWGWHSLPNPEGYKLADALREYRVAGRSVPYASGEGASGGYSPAVTWLRANPHRLHLGQIGLHLTKSDGSAVSISDLTDTSQTLDLWTGLLTSRLKLEGQPVEVWTACHPSRDLVAARVTSPLVRERRLSVQLQFPYGGAEWGNATDWNHPDRHTTDCHVTGRQADLTRVLDATRYYVRVVWSAAGELRVKAQHEYEVATRDSDSLDVIVAFSPTELGSPLPDFEVVRRAAGDHWHQFWTRGAAVDFSGSTDPRAAELERRVVLSQYLTAIQCAGSCPPQETGLTCNSRFGKFHLEMHWWHGVHFALWNRPELLERSLAWYESILPAARATATMQG